MTTYSMYDEALKTAQEMADDSQQPIRVLWRADQFVLARTEEETDYLLDSDWQDYALVDPQRWQ